MYIKSYTKALNGIQEVLQHCRKSGILLQASKIATDLCLMSFSVGGLCPLEIITYFKRNEITGKSYYY